MLEFVISMNFVYNVAYELLITKKFRFNLNE